MSIRPYPDYKESHFEGLGEIPTAWVVTRLKHLGSIKYGIGEPPTYVDEGTPLIRATNVSRGLVTPEKMAFVDPEDIPASRILWLRRGDIIVVRSGALTGDSALIREDYAGSIAGFDMVFRASPIASPDFLQYVLLTPYVKEAQIDISRMRAAQPHLNAEELGDCFIAVPPLNEQYAIAEYLDNETSEIDEFIADQEELIGLLNERRAATISQTVTKGLDRSAPLKDSGVEWLGDVPEHWDLTPLRHLVREPLKYGANEAADSDDPDGVRYLRITDFDRDGRLRDETFRSLPADTAATYMVSPGDVLLARSGATVGKAFIVPEDSPPSCFAGYLIKVSTAKEKLLPGFFFAYTQSNSFSTWKSQTQVMATIQNIGADRYATLPVVCPPIGEQREITDYLDREIGEIDAAIADASEAISLSKERRTAVISAAVTGKVDVSKAYKAERATIQGVPVGVA